LPPFTIMKRLKDDAGVKTLRCRLGIGTKWELPAQRCLQFSLDAVEAAKSGDSSRPADSPDSLPEAGPAD
jgi:hypothetical protein